jgi:hypothetical protein
MNSSYLLLGQDHHLPGLVLLNRPITSVQEPRLTLCGNGFATSRQKAKGRAPLVCCSLEAQERMAWMKLSWLFSQLKSLLLSFHYVSTDMSGELGQRELEQRKIKTRPK